MEDNEPAKSNTKSKHVEVQDSFIQKWAIVLAGLVFTLAIAFYAGNFDGAITKSNEKWGRS